MCRSLAHAVQFVTSSSSCLLSPGHLTDDVARNRHVPTPWWPSCNLSNISSLMRLRITSLTPLLFPSVSVVTYVCQMLHIPMLNTTLSHTKAMIEQA